MVIDPIADRVEYGNKNLLKLLNCGAQDLSMVHVSRLFKTSLAQLITFTREVEQHGEGMTQALSIHINNGELGLEATGSLLLDGDRRLLCLVLRDRRKMQIWRMKNSTNKNQQFGLLQWPRIHEVFQQIEKENQLILSAAGEGIYGVDADGNTTFVNPAAERMLGFKAEELIGHNVHAAIHHSHSDGSDYCAHDCPIYAAFKDGAVHKVDNEVFWTKDGKPLPVEYTSTPILDNGRLVGAVVIFRDISERRESEAQLRNALAEVEQLKQRLELENAYLQEEISAGYNSYQIVERSLAIQRVLHQIRLVAPTDATVLITGESGTGKELIARAIHTASERNGRPLVRVNCAAIPGELFESEFFGHVRGAFSGAIQDRPGRFQLADGGTLFLDEVGEIPLSLQGKLLRVLQDSEFERVGDATTRKVDVRVIAATNRDLQKLVQEGKFREDLYFRLNVFPIHSVALRDRRDDIPLLITHFLKKTCQRFNKPELRISVAQMQRLQNYNWPGNIRELENLIERQVILSRGDKLTFDDLPMFHSKGTSPVVIEKTENLTESDCDALRYQAIVTALKRARGKLYGADGAAELLGVKPTTLASRMKKLGLDKRSFAESV
ncbi:PAS domain S-box protein [Saccharophagus sp. K07]|nr:PAS domain S-box protein [Saccharophagus sp. K07]